MSKRKPKAIIIRDEDDSDIESPIQHRPTETNKKKRGILNTSQPDIEVMDDDIEDLSFKLTKSRTKRSGLQIPLIKEFDYAKDQPESNDTYEFNSGQNIAADHNRNTTVPVSIPPIKVDKANTSQTILTLNDDYSMEKITNATKEHEYISLDDFGEASDKHRKGDQSEEEDHFVQDTYMIDDGILSLTERENERQKKLLRMEIEEAIDEAAYVYSTNLSTRNLLTNPYSEISVSEDFDNWEDSRLKQGNIIITNESNGPRKPPTLNLLNRDSEALSTEVKRIQELVREKESEKFSTKQKMEQILNKKDSLIMNLATLKDQVHQIKE